MQLTKVQIKILHGDEAIWSHFCYVPTQIKTQFDDYVNTENYISNYWIYQWAYRDFQITSFDTPEGVAALKEAIKAKYRDKYPEIYVESVTDNQGWLRVWYTENMEQELRSIGR